MLRSIILALMVSLVHCSDFSGVWKLTMTITPFDTVDLPDQLGGTDAVTMELQKSADDSGQDYKVIFQAGNLIMGGVSVVDELSDTIAKVQFTKQMSSTRMLSPPEYQPAETFILESIPQMTSMHMNSDGELTLEGETNLLATFELTD